MRRTALAFTTGLALGALVLTTGCGDDNGSTGDAPTKAEFVKQVEPLYKKFQRDIQAAGDQFFSGSTKRSEADFVNEKLTPLLQGFLDDLGQLTPPEGDEQEVAAIIDAGEQGLKEVQANPSLLRAPQGSKKDPFREFSQLGPAYFDFG